MPNSRHIGRSTALTHSIASLHFSLPGKNGLQSKSIIYLMHNNDLA
jgi:hypothetical protein